MSEEAKPIARPIYFLLNTDGLTIFDIRFSKTFAPNKSGLLLGGLVHAISTFSDSVIDGGIAGESGTLNVIEREGMKIMFERGQRIEAILVVNTEDILLMEKIRAVIDLFEQTFLHTLDESLVAEKYLPFRDMTRKYLQANIDENVIFKKVKDTNDYEFELPDKFKSLLSAYDGKKPVTQLSRNLNWPISYVLARTILFQQLGHIKSIDVSIKNTDIFEINDTYIGLLLEQGGAYRSVHGHWGDWGVKIAQKIDGKHTIDSLANRFGLSRRDKSRLIQLFRYLSIRGYIKTLSDSELMLIIFQEFLNIFRSHLIRLFGNEVTFDIIETILQEDLNYANKKGKAISIAKLIESYPTGFHVEKLNMIMRKRSQYMKPLFQAAFFPFLDNMIRVLTKILGRKAAMDFLQSIIIETEKYYGTVVYDILFSS
jgi:hypothetical protein